MSPDLVLDLVRESLFTVFKVAGPSMAVALVVGLAVSLFQALTQIQEVTLVFIPKIASIFVAFLVFGPFMMESLINFTTHLFTNLNTYIR